MHERSAIAANMFRLWIGMLSLAGQDIRAQSRSDTVAIEHATVIPMDRDTALTDHTVLVAGDRIVWVGPSRAARVPLTSTRIDARNRYLIPGLADMHVHLGTTDDLARYLAAGVTTIRIMNGLPVHLVWRNRVASGALDGPRIYTAGMAVGRRDDSTHVRVRTPAEAEALVRAQKRAGFDMVKVQSGLEKPVFDHLLSVAREEGIPVVGHVVEGIGSAHALAAGQATFEHANIHMFEGGEARLDEGARAIARAGTWVGTLLQGYNGKCDPPSALQGRIIGALRRAGVKLLAGTDARIGAVRPGTSLHCELRTLVAAGLSPYEALAAATRNAGEFAVTQLKERVPFGTITSGARAELVLLEADPRSDIRAVSQVSAVMRGGVWRSAK